MCVADLVMHRIVAPEYVGSNPIVHLTKLKELGPNRLTLGRRGTVRFGYLKERDGSLTSREKTYAWELEVEPARE